MNANYSLRCDKNIGILAEFIYLVSVLLNSGRLRQDVSRRISLAHAVAISFSTQSGVIDACAWQSF